MFPILYSLTCIQKNVFIPVSPILMRLTLNKDRFNKSEALLLFLWGKNKTLIRSCLVKVTYFQMLIFGSCCSDQPPLTPLELSSPVHFLCRGHEIRDLSPPEQEPSVCWRLPNLARRWRPKQETPPYGTNML